MSAKERPPAYRPDPREMALVRSAANGATEAWHELVVRYSGLIQAVIRRQIGSSDPDDVRTVYVDVLVHLHSGGLASFGGRASLASWLALVARNRALDFVRSRIGRRDVPMHVKKLGDRDRRVFDLYYRRGLDFDEIRERLSSRGHRLSMGHLAAALRRIDDRIDGRVVRNCAYERRARALGAPTGRLLEFLDHARLEAERAAGSALPDVVLLEKEARRVAERVSELMRQLSEEDRRILSLRFQEGASVPEIVDGMGLPNRRKAYTLLARALRRMRCLAGIGPSATRPAAPLEEGGGVE